MLWNWQQPDWPSFTWKQARLAAAEKRFRSGGGVFLGTIRHIEGEERRVLLVEAMSTESATTSAIEGEVLDRASVQSSIQRQLGLKADPKRIRPSEEGVAEMMVDLYRTSAKPLSEEMLFGWHRRLMKGRGLRDLGRYRDGGDPMQVISGAIGKPRIHFEAPPARRGAAEMKRFVAWFNRTGPDGKASLPALTRSGAAHLYFESIHPFEDGNGRIGRAIAEKALAQGASEIANEPILLSLSATILAHRGDYYRALERANKANEITTWLAWFAGIALEAQQRTLASVDFLIEKARLIDSLREEINPRQHKAILRMLREGPEGFKGGLSAGNYATITGASPATTTRDLADLVDRGALLRTGELRHARYHLNLKLQPPRSITINQRGDILEKPASGMLTEN
jgi:Fic family protein